VNGWISKGNSFKKFSNIKGSVNMKKLFSMSLVLVLVLVLVLSGCSSNNSGNENNTAANNTQTNNTQTNNTEKNDTPAEPAAGDTQQDTVTFDPNVFEPALDTSIEGKITLWAAWPLDSWVGQFNSIYPNVEVEMVVMDEVESKLKTALAAGSGAPDIAFLDGGLMGNYNTIEGFVDLYQPPYNGGQYAEYFPESTWNKFISLDGKELISIPTDIAPAVTLYRTDVMEENGFPSDPAELGAYIKDPDNFINMAKTLKAQDKYLIQWDSEPLGIYTFGIGFFNRQLEWQRNTQQFVEGLDLAKRFKQEKLASNIDFWSDEGTQAITSGKLAMVYLGNWGSEELSYKTPDTAGKWHATNLPFGAYGAWGGASLGITTQSENKELSWEFIRQILLNNVYANKENIASGGTPAFLPAYELADELEQPNEFLGGQKPLGMYEELITKIPQAISTPLDAKAQEIWNKGIQEALEKNIDSKTALQNIQDEIEKVMQNDIAKLKEELNIQ
jgi:multiple sugar transport system substrate-binding protein